MVCITVLMTGYWHCATITHPLLPTAIDQVNLIHKFCENNKTIYLLSFYLHRYQIGNMKIGFAIQRSLVSNIKNTIIALVPY